MPPEHSPPKATDTAVQGGDPVPPEDNPGFWFELTDERVAGAFVDLTPRTLQAYRQRGGGPQFIRISSRCIKYRRVDLRTWSEARLRSSTADPGQESSVMRAPQTKTPAVGAPPPGPNSVSQRRSTIESEPDEDMRKSPRNQA